jgi:hypothetical protein
VTPLPDVAIGLIALTTPLGFLTLWMLLLNRRDRRRDAVEAIVGVCCAELGLRGATAIDVRMAIYRRRATVAVDMRLCTTEEMWQLIERVGPRLPQRATLRVVASCPAGRQVRPSLQRAVVVTL